MLRVLPSDKGFDAGDLAAEQVDLGLVVQAQFAALDPGSQFVLQLRVGSHVVAERLVVDLDAVAASVLGRIHRGIGLTQQIVDQLRIVDPICAPARSSTR